MILDTLENADLYANLHPAFAAAFALLRREDLASLPEGRHDIDGDASYAWVAKARAARLPRLPLRHTTPTSTFNM